MKIVKNATILEDDLNYINLSLKKELEILKYKKILITGGAGYVGTVLTNQLINCKVNVTLIII